MQEIRISEENFDSIIAAADKGTWTTTAVSLVTPGHRPTKIVTDADYLVIENGHFATIITLDSIGRPEANLIRGL